jgi:type 1 glutamine amidotransferase
MVLSFFEVSGQKPGNFKVLVLSENGGHHIAYSTRAKQWLDSVAVDSNFSVTYISDTKLINKKFLHPFSLFIQLDYPPYGWTALAVDAFEEAVSSGKIGWLGFHHASLLGEFDGYPMWTWFHAFMGSIRWKNYIPGFAKAEVVIEDSTHPVMKNIPSKFIIEKEEWYTYDQSPRENVHVIASVNESSYIPASDIKMGDHPVIWTNPRYPKNLYIFMGHGPDLFDNIAYTTLFRNAISYLHRNKTDAVE